MNRFLPRILAFALLLLPALPGARAQNTASQESRRAALQKESPPQGSSLLRGLQAQIGLLAGFHVLDSGDAFLDVVRAEEDCLCRA